MINPASLIGAIFGFLIGSYLGGPFIGIIFGFIGSSIGSGIGTRIFRNSRQNEGSSAWFSGWGYASASDGPIFMESLFSMLGRLAAADGHVSPEEERAFKRIVLNELRITDPQSVASALEIYHKATVGNLPMGVYARKAAASFHSRPQLLEMMLIIMVRVSVSGSVMHAEEDRLLRETAAIFGFSSSAYESLKARYGAGSQPSGASSSSSLKTAYDILGVMDDAHESEVRKAYRKKVNEYHPDKIAAKGLPKDFTDLANKKFQEIQEAWDNIRTARGF